MNTSAIKIFILCLVSVSILVSCSSNKDTSNSKEFKSSPNAEYEVVLKSEVEWTHLNPKRGDKAPMAGTLWGDRSSKDATGFLLKPSDGFSSPPHIHNVSYRGIVISGVIHNDDTNAANMWMPAGSFWTQPKGEVHITSAKGTNTLAYIEIEEGPYLVLPEEHAFDSGERPHNLEKSNIVWVGASDITWVDQPNIPDSENGAQVAFLWGSRDKGQYNGTLIKLPAGFKGTINSYGSSFRAVLIQGKVKHNVPKKKEEKILDAGSYFGSKNQAKHFVSGEINKETILYVRSNGKFDVVSQK